jgi:cytochrome c556
MVFLLVPLLGLALSGCGDENPNDPPVSNSSQSGAPGPEKASNPKLKAIMSKVGKGPQSLQDSLKAAIKEAEPAWDSIQPQAKEYSQLAAEAGSLDPPRGDKDSWSKLTLAFADSAKELDQAASAKDKDKTLTALDSLGNSCQGCHRQHRMMRGPGGPSGFGPPGGFPPPPGGPGGPPPGAGAGGPPTK